MLIDDLKELLKFSDPDVQTIQKFWKNSQIDEEYQQLKEQINQENFWKNKDQAQISQRFEQIKEQRNAYYKLVKNYEEYVELLDLFAEDENELQRLQKDIEPFVRSIKKFKINMLLNEPDDKSNCFMSINAGAGGTESQDWANMVLRMYVRFCEENKLTAQLVDYQAGEEAGIKRAYCKANANQGTRPSPCGMVEEIE